MRAPVAIALALLVGAGVAADRLAPAKKPHRAAVAPVAPGGVWGCPVVYPGNGVAWVHVANASVAASKVTVAFVRDRTTPLYQTFRLAGLSARSIQFPASERHSSGAVVSYAGGEVYASHTAAGGFGQGFRGGIGSECLRAGERTLVVPSGSTLKSSTRLELLNPSSSDADVQISLLSKGNEDQPEGLKDIVIASMSRREIRLEDYAFDTKTVSALVHVRTGVVVAEAIFASPAGVTVVPAVAPSSKQIVIGGTDSGLMLADAAVPGEVDALADASVLASASQSSLQSIESGIAASDPVAALLPRSHEPGVAVSFSVRAGGPLAAAARYVVADRSGNTDVASTIGVPPARRTVAVIGEPSTPPRTRLVLANPGEEPATVSVTLLTERGPQTPQALRSISVPAGRTVWMPVGPFDGPLGLVAVSDRPVAMAVLASATGKPVSAFVPFVAFAVTGEPFVAPPPVSVQTEPRLGVPAP